MLGSAEVLVLSGVRRHHSRAPNCQLPVEHQCPVRISRLLLVVTYSGWCNTDYNS